MRLRRAFGVMFIAGIIVYGCTGPRKAEPGLAFSGETRTDKVRLLVDETWTDAEGRRQVSQEIFNEVFSLIDEAEEFVLLDFFLVNEFLYEPGPGMRDLSRELTERLAAKRKASPEVEIIFISDPMNTVYGAVESPLFQTLERAGVRVVWTDLDRLRDSNPVFSKPWRIFVRPFGTGPGDALKNPLGEGRISLRSLLKLMNFKANHRKLIVTEKSLLVTSANPHSGSSAHWNVGLRVDGAGQALALEAESAVLRFSGAEGAADAFKEAVSADAPPVGGRLELLTESRIRDKALALLNGAESGDRIELTMFYFSHRELTRALVEARKRGCEVRVILDPNRDAFGRVKNGIPNRQTAARLAAAGIAVRWADTRGEQCHTKMLYVGRTDGTAVLLLGSGNYTRRNLDDFNCEADLAYTASAAHPCMERARRVFERWWSNADGRHCTVPYETYADPSRGRRLRAWFMERSGLSTF